MEEGVLVRWSKAEGETVEPGHDLALFKTATTDLSFSIETKGVLLKLLAEEGQTLRPGDPVVVVGEAGENIQNLIEQIVSSQTPNPESSTALALIPPGPLSVPTANHYVDKPLSNVRRAIAKGVSEANRDIPHLRLRTSFEAGPLLSFRARLNSLMAPQDKVSINDLLVRGVALALRRVPELNVAFVDNHIRYFTRVHLGVTVAIEGGSVTPVVRDADIKGISAISNEVKDLVERCKQRTLKSEEICGATFTVSNLGMYGIDQFDGILNPPQAAMLTVGRVRQQPIIDEHGKIGLGHPIQMTLNCDQRVIDPATAARFLNQLVALLERPQTLAL
jgi:pyruvate dehydrogenase E2 component (dihydrolipoamide acetyltransferase)